MKTDRVNLETLSLASGKELYYGQMEPKSDEVAFDKAHRHLSPPSSQSQLLQSQPFVDVIAYIDTLTNTTSATINQVSYHPDSVMEPSNVELLVPQARFLRSRDEVRDIFEELADRWDRDTLHLSSPSEAAHHPAYYRVIGLGLQAVPFILERLRSTRRYWFWALAAITGEDPAAGETDIDRAIDSWYSWGIERGYLPA